MNQLETEPAGQWSPRGGIDPIVPTPGLPDDEPVPATPAQPIPCEVPGPLPQADSRAGAIAATITPASHPAQPTSA